MSEIDEERCAAILDASDDYRVLRRFVPTERYAEPNDFQKKVGLVLDTETTGLDPSRDEIIELGLCAFEYDLAGRVYRVVQAESFFEQPANPIPAEIVRLTGINDEMVAGQKFPDGHIDELISKTDLIIAHNASFDRPFCENRFAWASSKPWACSLGEIDWRDELGAPSAALQCLAWQFGFFFEGHRAVADCRALLHILAMDVDGQTILSRLLLQARQPSFRIYAVNSPFETKDTLKVRGYRWDASISTWYRDIGERDRDMELQWLKTEILQGNQPRVEEFSALTRYSSGESSN
jgi:DNA polymerase III subunit epsilon